MVTMCSNLINFVLHEGKFILSSNYFTMFFMMCTSFDIIVVTVHQVNLLQKFLRDLLQCSCFSGGSGCAFETIETKILLRCVSALCQRERQFYTGSFQS